MAKKPVNIWYDPEWDALEIMWTTEGQHTYGAATDDERVMAFVDQDNNVLGLHITGISELSTTPLNLPVKPGLKSPVQQ